MSKLGPNVIATDVKSELGPTLAAGWKALGYETIFSNPTRAFHDLCPHTNFNLQEAVIDCYWSDKEKLYRNTGTFFRSQLAITNPPPPPGSMNEYFTNGGIDAAYAIGGYHVKEEPERATHGRTLQVASDPKHARDLFKDAASWLKSEQDTFANDVSNAAKRVLEAASGRNEHHLADFLKHVTSPLSAFDSTGYLANEGEMAMARISDLRTSSTPMVLVCMTPLSHLMDYSIFTSLFVNALFQACKMHPTGRPVHCCMDEFTALRLSEYDKELITLRGLGCSSEVFIQSFEALAERTSPAAAATIVNQSDIKTWTALDSFKDARELSDTLGSCLQKEYDANLDGSFEGIRFGLKDVEVPLMSPQAILAMPRDEQIIQIRGMYPIHAKKIRAWEIRGICELLGENPLEGPVPDSEIKAELDISVSGVKLVSPKVPKRFSKPKKHRKSVFRAIYPASYLWLVAWVGIYFGAPMSSPDINWPALRISYSYVGSYSNPHYTMCRYMAINGDRFARPGGHCPFVMVQRGSREWR